MDLCAGEKDTVGDVYVGRVCEVKKELAACFVRISPGVKGFLREGECEGGLPAEGSQVVVRVKAGSVKTKQLSLTMKVEKKLREKGAVRSLYSVLKKGEPTFVKYLRRFDTEDIREVVTDIGEVYDRISSELDGVKSRLYTDSDLPLKKLYSVDERMEELLGRRVYLKSGANLIIDHTEAMNVIDVNSSKAAAKKDRDHAIHSINTEAAIEAARQIRLRNLSGIILIDFINYDEGGDAFEQELLTLLRSEFEKDDNRTRVIDMTPLGICELTRRRSRPPLYEQL